MLRRVLELATKLSFGDIPACPRADLASDHAEAVKSLIRGRGLSTLREYMQLVRPFFTKGVAAALIANGLSFFQFEGNR